MKRVTIKDIARKLDLSVSTVSRALANDKLIRKETRELVFRTAKELGYRRNPLAASLRMGRTKSVGVIVNGMLTPFASQIFKGIQNVMPQNGITILFFDSDNDSEIERNYLYSLENLIVDGIIIANCLDDHNNEDFVRLQRKGVPMVFVDHFPVALETLSVGVNSRDKAFFLVDHLLYTGKRRILHIKGPDVINDYPDVFKAYKEALMKYKVPFDPNLVEECMVDPDKAAELVDRLLDNGLEFDAVFAYHDLIAIGAMNRLQERGLRVPEDVAVAGFSGSLLSRLAHPGLTTMEPDLFDMGVKAAELLLEKIDNPSMSPHRVEVSARLVYRASSQKQPISLIGDCNKNT